MDHDNDPKQSNVKNKAQNEEEDAPESTEKFNPTSQFVDDAGDEDDVEIGGGGFDAIPIRKAKKTEWLRTLFSKRVTAYLLEDDSDGRIDCFYVLSPDVAKEILKTLDEGLVSRFWLVPAITREGSLFLWKIKRPRGDSPSSWYRTAMQFAEAAEAKWTRVVSNLSSGGYFARTATGDLPEPTWPDLTTHQMVDLAAKGRSITSLGDPVLGRILRGEK